ncbi:MAG: rod shape-determining protein [Patescibacteria group bacterium]
MSRISHWFSYDNPIFSRFTIEACCDIGSANCRISLGKKLVFNQPTCLAVHKQTGEVVAYGQRAHNFLGKTPQSIEIVFPIENGRVVDRSAFSDLLNILYRDVLQSTFRGLVVNVQGKFGLAIELSPVEKEIFSKILKNSGFGGMEMIEQNRGLLELYRRRGPDSSLCILDLGATKAELSIFSLGELVYQKSIDISGNSLNDEIVNIVRSQQKIDIGWITAEEIKRQVVLVSDENNKQKERQLIIRGKDMLTNLVRTEKIASNQFDKLAKNFASRLMDEVQLALADISAKAVADSMMDGIFLTGGTSKLQGLAEFLSARLSVEVIKTLHPETDGVMGLSMMADGQPPPLHNK